MRKAVPNSDPGEWQHRPALTAAAADKPRLCRNLLPPTRPGLNRWAEDRAYFLAALRRHGNSAEQRRMNALLLLDDGWTAERVAEALFIDAETVRAHRRLYAAAGRAGVERLAMPTTRPC
jgi:hypothetical protein